MMPLLRFICLPILALLTSIVICTLCMFELSTNWQLRPKIVAEISATFQQNVSMSILTAAVDSVKSTFQRDHKLSEQLTQISDMVKLKEVDCVALFNKPSENIIPENTENSIADKAYIKMSSDCRSFQLSRGYIMSQLTKEEEDFPLAFSLIVYKDAEMIERLLRAIYRPQNYYCIHVDKESPEAFFRAVSSIAGCFPNVFLTSNRTRVLWGDITVLEADLHCMKELLKYPKWKYFFNLTGQEFPLKTNYELVKILTAYNGANDIECTIKNANKKRWRNKSPPRGIRAVKGSVHISVNRDFVEYIVYNETGKSILDWTKDTEIPDETFFSSLHCNPQLGIRGSYQGEPELTKPFLTRLKRWKDQHSCAGRFVRDVCILSTGDLPVLGHAKELFANKFFLNKDRVVIGCLEEKIFNDTRDEYLGVKTFNTDYYASLDFVKNKVL